MNDSAPAPHTLPPGTGNPALWLAALGLIAAVRYDGDFRAMLCLGELVRHPAALDGARIVQDRLDDLQKRALVLGNGDLNALLWDRDGALCLRVAKNDLWDARLDTSQDPPLLKVVVANLTWSGGGYPPSWKKPSPRPRCAAVVRIGHGAAEPGAWRCIRALGRTIEWVRRGDLGVMAIEGDGIKAIPNYARLNRGGGSEVWLIEDPAKVAAGPPPEEEPLPAPVARPDLDPRTVD